MNARGDGHHGILAQYDEDGNHVRGDQCSSTGHQHGHVHTIGLNSHQHTWNNGDWTMQGSNTVAPTDYSNMTLDRSCINNDVQFWTNDIMVNNKNLTKAVEDMATLLKMIVEKYDLHEVKKLVEDTEVAIWAECKKDMAEEKKEHLDEKLFEI
jgi:hypothetical protein